MPHDLTIALVIPTYNREEPLEYTLRGILAGNQGHDELIVVDQTVEHTARTTRYLEELHKSGSIRWLHCSPPNLNGARNYALANAKSDILIFIDDDVLLCPGFVAAHRKNFDDETVCAAGGRTLQAQGSYFLAASKPWPHILDYRFIRMDGVERIEGIATFMGGNHSIRTEYARRMGGYDEQFIGPQRDETDMSIRIWQAGGKIVFDPAAELLHYAYKSGGGRRQESAQPEWIKSHQSQLLNWRYHYPSGYFWRQLFWGNIRRYVLRKENSFRPWRLPWAFAAYWYACWRAWRTARTGKISNTKQPEGAAS